MKQQVTCTVGDAGVPSLAFSRGPGSLHPDTVSIFHESWTRSAHRGTQRCRLTPGRLPDMCQRCVCAATQRADGLLLLRRCSLQSLLDPDGSVLSGTDWAVLGIVIPSKFKDSIADTEADADGDTNTNTFHLECHGNSVIRVKHRTKILFFIN